MLNLISTFHEITGCMHMVLFKWNRLHIHLHEWNLSINSQDSFEMNKRCKFKLSKRSPVNKLSKIKKIISHMKFYLEITKMSYFIVRKHISVPTDSVSFVCYSDLIMLLSWVLLFIRDSIIPTGLPVHIQLDFRFTSGPLPVFFFSSN